MVTDVFDCTFECLRLPSCVSVNVASNKEAPGNIFCEFLSSDKYQKSQKFTGNKTSHHLFKKVKVSEKLAERSQILTTIACASISALLKKKYCFFLSLIVKISTETTAFKTNRLTKQIKSEPTI